MSANLNHISGAPAAWLVLLEELAGCKPHVIRGIATAADFEKRNDHLLKLAAAIDRYLATLGAELGAQSRPGFDMSLFRDQMLAAIEGNATFVIGQEALALRGMLEAAE